MLKGIEEGIEKIQHITTDLSPELEAKLKDLKEHLVLPKGNYFMPYNIVIGQEGRLEIMPGTKLFFERKMGFWLIGH